MLVAIEQGAKGPDKDCGYEGPFLKAISGIPISMEGKTAARAHFSPLGNIAAACADLWSNESVQNIKLLAGMAPTVYFEQLEYDTRLMNQAVKGGKKDILQLQQLFVESDTYYDPQAFILSPHNVIEISKEIVKGQDYINATKKGCLKGLSLVENALFEGKSWIEILKTDIESIPTNESEFIESILPTIDKKKILLSEYGL
jgi:methanol--5-hydroxybenzimidazolylcobamide Co-methyltransferase